MDSVVASVASGVAGLVGSIEQRKYEERQAQIQRQWNETMMDKQNAWNLEQWQRQNQYNSPSAQLQRLRQAGLNPLNYGLDGSSAQGLESAQSLGYDRASLAGAMNPISSALDSALKTAQVSNIQAQTAKVSQETLSEVVRREQMSQQIDNARQELENMKSSKNLTDKQVQELDKRISWIDRLNEANIGLQESQKNLNESTKKRIDELLDNEKKIQIKTLEDFDRQWKLIDSQISKIAKESGLLQKDIENYALNHTSNGFMGTGLSIQNFFRLLLGLPENTIRKNGQELNDYVTDGNLTRADYQQLINDGQ